MRTFIVVGLASIGLLAAASAHADNVALYRFHDGFNHFYTTACGKVPQGEFCYSGVEGYLADKAGADMKPLYRLFNGTYYLYTWDDAEKAAAMSNGYKDEGIEGYVATTAGPGKTPLYRSWHTNVGDRFLSIDQKEAEGGIPKDINPDVYGPYDIEHFAAPVYVWTSGKTPCAGRPAKVDKPLACMIVK
jgi:hypothetical protein